MVNQPGCWASSSVAILYDWQNVRGTQYQLQCLMRFACKLGTIAFKGVYAHWRRENFQLEEFFDELGFECFNVPSSKCKKNNVDKKLITHCKQHVLNNPDITTVILLSGDGDFKGIVCDLKAKGKKVIVVAECSEKASKKLVSLADEFHLLKQLC